MAPFPLPLDQLLGHWPQYVVYFLLGIAFGGVLELSGFGKSTKLAAQFYFKDMTVLKVMFGAIVVAMLLIFLMSGLGLLDYNLIWVNPTYLWPGIVGGLVMGVGFIVGGFCPGTSLVSAATGKLDGLFFVVGGLFGIFLFGETVGFYETWWNSSFMGRFTLMDLFNTSTGVIVVGVVIMALAAFFMAEQSERFFGKLDLKQQPKWRFGAAGGVLALSLVVAFIGQPTTETRWAKIAPEKNKVLSDRAVQIEPVELLSLIHDDKLKVILLDVRSEADYNVFHILDSENVSLDKLKARIPALNQNESNTVVITISNGETLATQAWQTLVAESVPNVYILGGGINAWLEAFADEKFKQQRMIAHASDDALRYHFGIALGTRHAAADPNPNLFKTKFEPKVKLALKRGPTAGGCG